ncbi:sugar phosphate isomerase/epimerase family protein [Desulfoferrobacter suflitae]|uniref:sugar phosphate isomerase/epimerase family protein n=1 Tax=Desulfoferrobacter suflitae TaxID=2865782 RepID=UPI002164D18E|nr:sugar phosphate isomerase/epimerase [Desulfoferrobacter suflitae]MCK8601811.1 sugar phosphate isomerase/epimerase [Desulfoferrobacter suflitae]
MRKPPQPKLAMCNFIRDAERLRQTALDNGFHGVDWTFELADLPTNDVDETKLLKRICRLHPLEVRYHCAFQGVDLGDCDVERARQAMDIFRKVCRLVAKLDGKFMTVHLGLGLDSSNGLSWERSVGALADLVSFGQRFGIRVCLENLACGWSSRPELFEKLVRKSNAGITLDIGHARMSPSVRSQFYAFEDFISPHNDRVFNAHIYHEERNDGHTAPERLEDLMGRLRLLSCLACDWWVLELREESALFSTLKVVREYFERAVGDAACTLYEHSHTVQRHPAINRY